MDSTAETVGDVAPSVLDALLCPDETAIGLAAAVPQGELVAALGALAPAALGVDARVNALVALERHIAMLQARSAELLAAIEADVDGTDGFEREAVACALRVPPASMLSRMASAQDLIERLPGTLALLRAGRISQRYAFDVADATRTLPVEAVRIVEVKILARAPEQTAAQLRASVKRAVLGVSNAADEQAAHDQAVAERRVIVTPVENGMAELWALLPADGAARIKSSLDAMAYQTIHGRGGDERSADQRRADALVELASTVAAGDSVGRSHGQRPAVQVAVAASTLMGLDDQPAELDGYGPITAAMARRIAADPTGRWRRVVTDDEGRVLSAGRKVYRPPADMVATVIACDQHCAFPGCRRHARHCDLDHVRAYRPADTTTAANLSALCRRHHRLKHTGTWRVERDDHRGVTAWTDPHRRRYETRPPHPPTTAPESQRNLDPPPF